jgi:hypothetical protein
MKRATVPSILVAVVLLVLCVSAEAQQPKKVPRIGYLANSDAATESARSEAIRLALRELGHIEGQNIATEYRYAEGKHRGACARVDYSVLGGTTFRPVYSR